MCSKHDMPEPSATKRVLSFLHSSDCVGDLELMVDPTLSSTIPRSCTVKIATPSTSVFISLDDFRWIREQQQLFRSGQLTEGEDGDDIVFPEHWNNYKKRGSSVKKGTPIIEDRERLHRERLQNFAHMYDIIKMVRKTSKVTSMCDVLQKVGLMNLKLGKHFGANLSHLRALVPTLDPSRMCLLAAATKTSHLPPRTVLHLNQRDAERINSSSGGKGGGKSGEKSDE